MTVILFALQTDLKVALSKDISIMANRQSDDYFYRITNYKRFKYNLNKLMVSDNKKENRNSFTLSKKLEIRLWQCSNCSKIFTNEQFNKLPKEEVFALDVHFKVEESNRIGSGIDPREKYHTPICDKCGTVFHVNNWLVKSEINGYEITTKHAEVSNTTVDVDGPNLSARLYWFRTTVDDREYIQLKVIYEDKVQAMKGHEIIFRNIEQIIMHHSLLVPRTSEEFIQSKGCTFENYHLFSSQTYFLKELTFEQFIQALARIPNVDI